MQRILVGGILLSLCLIAQAADKATTSLQPNIIIILADDMGFSDIGCYGGEIETPNLNLLAANGLRFKPFYNTGRCCPTRASLLTGLHPHQAGIGHMTEGPTKESARVNDPYQGYLNQNCVTLAQVLKPAGYKTYLAGKWHLGYHRKDTWPLQRGFDRFYGILSGACDYFKPTPPRGLTLDNEPVKAPREFYATDAFTDYAIRFMKETPKEAPFFLYLAYNAPHWPLQAKKADLDKYVGKYKEGWNVVQKRRLERQIKSGLIDPKWKPAPHEGPDWDKLSAKEKETLDMRMAAYAACVDSVDQNIGRVIKSLKATGRFENTLIFFLADNGGCAEGGILGRGTIEQFRNPTASNTYGTLRCGRAWANVSNTPFRLYKHFVHEGGMSTPLIAHWPQGIPKNKNGQWIESYGSLPDFMPTCVELAGAHYPKTVPPMEGRSLVPLLQGADRSIHPETIFWEHEGNRAARQGDWKLVKAKKDWELYDVNADRTEMKNLIAQKPEKAEGLKSQWEAWAKRVGAKSNPPRKKKNK